MRTVVTARGWICFLVAAILTLAAASSAGAAEPAWRITSVGDTTTASDGESSTADHIYRVFVEDTGAVDAEDSVAPLQFQATLPPGFTLVSIATPEFTGWQCPGAGLGATSLSCTSPGEPFFRHEEKDFVLRVSVGAGAAAVSTARFAISGGGAPAAETVDPTAVDAGPVPFGLDAVDSGLTGASGQPFTQAGGHPYAFTTALDFNTETKPGEPVGSAAYFDTRPVEPMRDFLADLPPGLVGNVAAFPQCTETQLGALDTSKNITGPLCPPGSQVGVTTVRATGDRNVNVWDAPVYSMVPGPGEAARFGFAVANSLVTISARLRSDGDYGLTTIGRRTSEGLTIVGGTLTIWGTPGSPSHDAERSCAGILPPIKGGPSTSLPSNRFGEESPPCPEHFSQVPFLRMPTSCTPAGQGLPFTLRAGSWFKPAAFLANGLPDLGDPNWKSRSVITHNGPGYPYPEGDWGAPTGVGGCAEVPVKATLSAAPTAIDTETSSGLGVHVEIPNPGLEFSDRIASSDIESVKVALPQGMTINPSQAEGLGACSPARYRSSALSFHPDGSAGCPSDSKIGTVEVHTPLLEETVAGSVYVATPYDNPSNSLLALYVVLEEPQRGILVKLAGGVSLDPASGRITASFDDLPQLPFSSFDFKFREGARAPLVTPPACGTYETVAEFTGHSDPDGPPLVSRSSFQVTRGIGGGLCPSGGLPPFRPLLQAGTVNNRAGAYSPFNVRLTRTDAEQEFTNFSLKLPPGLIGKLAGIGYCSDVAIAAAKSREGKPGGGAEEIASPSCPASSEVGRTMVGGGVGPVQAYVPGKLYFAGPYHGSAISLVSITAAKVGPFDLGTVVVRFALRVDPETAEVFIDSTGSDPIPHLIQGVTVHLRDIRAYADRPEFVLNPTSCARTSVASTVLGSGLDFGSAADDRPVTVSTPYQAADCAALAFKPDLKLQLKGGTKRAGHPSLKAVLKMKGREANIARAQVILPKSEFLDQSHIGTVCTRVQYAKDACPAKSIYGYAKAITPILDEPLAGPVYLRSSEHKLPDLVAGLKSGKIEIDLAGRIDSVDGQIRTTFESVPDAPVSKFVLTMQGGKKGLLENSTNLCARPHKAIVEFDGQNGKISDSTPVLKPQCKGKQRKAAKRRNAR